MFFNRRPAKPLLPKTETKAKPRPSESAKATPPPAEIGMDDLARVDLRVGLVREAAVVPEAEKLIRLMVDLGEGRLRQIFTGMRAYCTDVYPLADTDTDTISVEIRERLGDVPTTTDEFTIEITGSASVLTSSRLHRFMLKLPAGENWTNGQGLLVEAQPDGYA